LEDHSLAVIVHQKKAVDVAPSPPKSGTIDCEYCGALFVDESKELYSHEFVCSVCRFNRKEFALLCPYCILNLESVSEQEGLPSGICLDCIGR